MKVKKALLLIFFIVNILFLKNKKFANKHKALLLIFFVVIILFLKKKEFTNKQLSKIICNKY